MFILICKYIKANFLFALVVLYFFISAGLNLLFSIDILIPCLIESATGFHCPGCGLSTAFLNLVKLNLPEAWEANPIIFFVLPAGTWFIASDFFRFRKTRT